GAAQWLRVPPENYQVTGPAPASTVAAQQTGRSYSPREMLQSPGRSPSRSKRPPLVLFAFINQLALFVVLTGLVFFGWGGIFSLFPSTLTDTFGPRYAATNYGFLYMAHGVGSILGGPAAAFLKEATGRRTAVFIVVALLDALTALLAITALRRMRQGHLAAG